MIATHSNVRDDLANSWFAPWVTYDPHEPHCGYVQLPNWVEWGLSVAIGSDSEIDDIKRGVSLQNLVAGTLSHSLKKAQEYLSGNLGYYLIVEELESLLGRRLC